MIEQRLVPFPARVGLGVEVVQFLAFPQRIFVDDAMHPGKGHGVGGVGLEFDGVGTGVGGGINNGDGALERLVVVARHFGDDERRGFHGRKIAIIEGS